MDYEDPPINYIKHHIEVKKAFTRIKGRRPTHISMYEALFALWNHYRFPPEFSINREELMKLSCIGSKNTYTKVIKQLHDWKLVNYMPSFDPLYGSKIRMIRFDRTITKSGKGIEKGNGNSTEKADVKVEVKVVGPLYKQEEIIENNLKKEEKKEEFEQLFK
jgi:hypothetical protein